MTRAWAEDASAALSRLEAELKAERERLIAVLTKQAEDAAVERRGSQERLLQAIDGQSALMIQVTQHLAKLDAPKPAAITTSEPSLEELAELRATEQEVSRVREGLLAEADRRGDPMSPKDADRVARDILSRAISG